MIQAVERVEEPFAVGVQWHPEHLFYARRQRAFFRALAVAATAYRNAARQIEVSAVHEVRNLAACCTQTDNGASSAI